MKVWIVGGLPNQERFIELWIAGWAIELDYTLLTALQLSQPAHQKELSGTSRKNVSISPNPPSTRYIYNSHNICFPFTHAPETLPASEHVVETCD
jgi:hypothetical protein